MDARRASECFTEREGNDPQVNNDPQVTYYAKRQNAAPKPGGTTTQSGSFESKSAAKRKKKKEALSSRVDSVISKLGPAFDKLSVEEKSVFRRGGFQ